jgi:hypothetical protein
MNIVLRLEIWPGFAVAIEEREGGLMVCLDSSHRVLRTETVYEYLYDFSKFLNVLLREVSVSSDRYDFVWFISGSSSEDPTLNGSSCSRNGSLGR